MNLKTMLIPAYCLCSLSSNYIHKKVNEYHVTENYGNLQSNRESLKSHMKKAI
jgi:hypothetical protein